MKLFIAGLIGRIAGSLLGLGWAVSLAQIYLAYVGIQNVILDFRRDKREAKKAAQDDEYHRERMKNLK